MAEIKREPIKIVIGDKEYEAFDENHTLMDILRWIDSMGLAEEAAYVLREELTI